MFYAWSACAHLFHDFTDTKHTFLCQVLAEPRRSLRQRGVASDGVSVVEERRNGAITTNLLLPQALAEPKERHPKGAAAGAEVLGALFKYTRFAYLGTTQRTAHTQTAMTLMQMQASLHEALGNVCSFLEPSSTLACRGCATELWKTCDTLCFMHAAIWNRPT